MSSPRCSGSTCALEAATADLYFDAIGEALATDAFRPRALFDRFRIDFLATTEGAQDDLAAPPRDPPRRAGRGASSPPIAPTA